MNQADRELFDMSFEKEGMHMALVSVDQGGAANGVKTLLMKSLDNNHLNEQQTKSFKEIAKALGQTDEEIQKSLEALEINTNGEAPVSDNNVEDVEKSSETSPKDEVTMTVETIEKSVYEAELQKAKDLQTKLEAEAEIKKGLEAELKEFRKARFEAEKAEFITKAKTLDVAGIEGDAIETMAVAMQKASMQEDTKVLVETIEKMATLLKSAGSLQTPEGHSLETKGEDLSGTMALIKSKNTSK